ncbi:MAG: prolipoprotein diacylglyceryl transferase, partial [Ktedonobacteraceae bacterium]|nr:prolipoprotein diacylglyceryl transferase [Ktedonobacteraceae bacterium]
MAQKTSAHARSERHASPQHESKQKEQESKQTKQEVEASDGWTRLLKSATQEILAVTYWFEPAPHPEPYAVTVRFTGQRVMAKKKRARAGDRFVHEETIEKVIPGSGPISVTARIRDINAGEWTVTAQVLSPVHQIRELKDGGSAAPGGNGLPRLVARLWQRWAPPVSAESPVKTCLSPLARVPGIVPGIWGIMVTLGMIVALVLQSLIISISHLAIGPAWLVTLGAILVGIIGAKGWFIILHWRAHRLEGWCIQGFIVAATLAAAILLLLLHMPMGTFLDATAPGLLIAMAVGRVGCFFAGCCGGPPTAA